MVPLCSAGRTDFRGRKPPQYRQPQHDRPWRDSDKPARAATIFTHNGAPKALVGCLASSLSDWGLRLIAANDFGGCGGAGRWGWVQKAVEGAGDRRFLGTCLPSRRATALSGRDEGEHPLDVPDHGDEAPFTDRRSSSAAL